MSSTFKSLRHPVLLVILDGFGVNPSRANNAVAEAETPRLDDYFSRYPLTVLKASGRAVGLPEGQMGNSEVGHMTLGSGTVTRQDLVLINDAIEDKSFFSNKTLLAAMEKAKSSGKPLQLIGLVSDGGVHSHIRHLLALIELCKMNDVVPSVHMITDGRDTGPQVALDYLPALEDALKQAGGFIASVSGRYYAMDRDKRWDRSYKAWAALTRGDARKAESAHDAITSAYEAGETDEFIQPVVLPDAQAIGSDDVVVFFNFRNDRPRQLTAALSSKSFDGFERGGFEPVEVTCLTQYDSTFDLPIAFVSERPSMTLGGLISSKGLKQLRCAETEKYAHVTFFLNGGREDPFPGEDRVMVPSPKVATYDLAPEMSAAGVADATINAMSNDEYALIIVNFANGDMVGHTAVRDAVIKAVEVMDHEVGRVLDCAVEQKYSVILTADHGNCDELIDAMTGAPHTQHSVFPVPCLIVDDEKWRLSINAGLSSVAPTILQLMGMEQPSEMTGESLLHSAVTTGAAKSYK